MNLLFMQNGLSPYGIPRNGLVALYDPYKDTYGRNILPVGSDDFQTGWSGVSGATATVTPVQETINGQNVTAYRIQTTGGTSTQKYAGAGVPSISGIAYAVKIYIKNNAAKNLAYYYFTGNGITVVPSDTFTQIKQAGASNGSDFYRFYVPLSTDNLDITVYQPQVNLSTLYPYSAPAGLPQSLTDYTGRGNNAVLGSTAGSDTNDPKYNGVALVGDGVDDYAVVPLASAAYRISVVDSGSGFTFINEVPAYLNLFQTGASTYLNGKISPTAYYNRVLTAGEIAQSKAGLKRYMASKGVTVI